MFVRAGLAVGFLKQMAQGHRRTAWPHGAASALAHRRRAVWAARVVGRRSHSKRSCPTQVLVLRCSFPSISPSPGGTSARLHIEDTKREGEGGLPARGREWTERRPLGERNPRKYERSEDLGSKTEARERADPSLGQPCLPELLLEFPQEERWPAVRRRPSL